MSLSKIQTTICYCHLARSRPSPQDLKEALACAISSSCSSHHLRRLHGRAIASGLRHNLYLATLILTKYFHFGDARTARLVFDDCRRGGPTKALLWNSLIRGYLKHGLPESALDIYREMVRRAHCEPDVLTFHLVVTACTRLSDFALGSKVREEARVRGLASDLLVGTSLIDMYCKAGEIGTARVVFDEMACRDVVTWNAMISGYARVGLFYDAVNLFKIMRLGYEILPTEATLVSLISGCGCSDSLKDGQTLHAHSIKLGFERNLFVLNVLLEMYVNCDCLGRACQLFNRMEVKDAVSWSTMIGGFVQHKLPRDALRLFELYSQNTHFFPSRSILINVILACAELGVWEEGKLIEDKYLTSDDSGIASDSSIVTVLAYMHAKCGKLDVSLNLLNRFTEVKGDVIAWNAMMKACFEIGMVNKVLHLTLEMQRRDISPDHVTIITLLSAISCILSLKKAMETHAQIVKRGFELEIQIANSLVDAYAESGSIMYSSKVFSGIVEKDVVSWSIMIKAYAWNGKVNEVLDHFELMRRTKIRPNHYTFLSVLSACSHAGLVRKGWELFRCMKEEYNLRPGIEHLTCMVDMFCRAARLPEAYTLLENVMQQTDNHPVLWGTVLSACRFHGDVVIGEAAANNLFRLEPENAANYKMLAEIYMSTGRRDDANGVLKLLHEKGLNNMPGFSWFDSG
ncbi:pentatricopeptide repeat-containing protein [Canna indica]|uniref:Pentatricopeptide repeat-containing protein n=1 Tax=Canna indica TaxID=4628 RepID=A0AAQ3PZS1_9LILI|nr:pentatricopeptide repeat-containing protein [Canna indica]